jgi:hypothetical protein
MGVTLFDDESGETFDTRHHLSAAHPMVTFSQKTSRSDAMPPESSPAGQPNESFSQLDRVSLREILDEDCHPTFVVDLEHDTTGHDIQPIFVNTSLKRRSRLLSNVVGEANDSKFDEVSDRATSYDSFREWATAVEGTPPPEDAALSFRFDGIIWTSCTVRQRWRIISGDTPRQTTGVLMGESPPRSSPKTNTDSNRLQETTPAARRSLGTTRTPKIDSGLISTSERKDSLVAETSSSISLSTAEDAVPDWTAPHPRGVLTDFMAFVRTIDWGSTPLGAMEDWSVQFRELANLIMVRK